VSNRKINTDNELITSRTRSNESEPYVTDGASTTHHQTRVALRKTDGNKLANRLWCYHFVK